jgi:hypothetical protein
VKSVVVQPCLSATGIFSSQQEKVDQPMTNHKFQWNMDGWQCKVCQWRWKTRKRSKCPGVIRYEFGAWPNHLKTAGELSHLGMNIPSSPDGCYYQRLEPHWLWLYDKSKAAHLRPSVSKHITLLLRTNEKCQQCGRQVEDELDDPHIVDGLCFTCRFEKDWLEQRNEIRAWAQASLHAHRTVLLDTDSVSSTMLTNMTEFRFRNIGDIGSEKCERAEAPVPVLDALNLQVA